MKRELVSLGFGSVSVPLGSHIAVFYRNREEQRAVVLPYIKTGLEQGAKCISIVGEETRESLAEALQGVGVEARAALASGRLSILTVNESYLSQGYFSPEKMLDFLELALRSATKEGYRQVRLTGGISWVLREAPGAERWAEYEARLNKMLDGYPQITICLYNVTKFPGDLIIDALKTHPDCILGGIIIHNHFYVAPDDFLRELEEQPS